MDLAEALTFDDVLLVPKRSGISTRKDVNTAAQFSRNILLSIPIASANMDTVTEANMAIAMAREGGIGIIHRFMTIEHQVAEVIRVKRSESFMIENPHTLDISSTLKEAHNLMQTYGIGGLLVVRNDKLSGILTNRDMIFENDMNKPVSEIMTRFENIITASPGLNSEEYRKILKENKIEKLPIVDSEQRLCGLVTSKDILKKEKYPFSSKDKKGRLIVGAAIGVKNDYLQRAEALINAGADVIVIDIAHGHSDMCIETVKNFRDSFGNHELIVGNVATAAGCEDLIRAGADSVKVGVGGGSVCTTRIITGAGIPQLTAIADCANIAGEYGVPIIADGGIKNSGDITKAIAAGCSCVMCGNLFAGTEESPGMTLIKNGRKYKIYRGMAGFGANIARKERENNMDDISGIVPEGVESLVPYKGSIYEVLHQLVGGLRSGMSYCGARNVKELQQNSKFVKITKHGLTESHAHDVEML